MQMYVFGILSVLMLFILPKIAEAQNRIALVIGNDTYTNLGESQQLRNARNDARSIANALKQLGFMTIQGEDLGRRQTNEKLQEFVNRIQPGDVALVFYSGHGIQLSGENYLLPADIPKVRNNQRLLLKEESIAVRRVLQSIQSKRTRATILILDACRSDPFAGGSRSNTATKGLVPISAPNGTIVLYSAGANQEALDRLGDQDTHQNSVFTRHMLPLMIEPQLEISALSKRLRKQVYKAAQTVGHDQVPALYNEMIDDFYFLPNRTLAQRSSPATANSILGDDPQEETLWTQVKSSNLKDDYEFYLEKYPRGKYAAVAELLLRRLMKKRRSASGERQPSFSILSPLTNAIVPGKQVYLRLRFSSGRGQQSGLNILTNGRQVLLKPVFIDDQQSGRRRDVRVEVPLYSGRNDIEVTAFNNFGVVRKRITVTSQASAGQLDQMGDLYLVAIGVDKYPGAINKMNLEFAGRDAREFHRFYLAANKARFRNQTSVLLTNQGRPDRQPTYNNIVEALDVFSRATARDTVVLYVVGHGLNDHGRSYFIPTDAVATPGKGDKENGWKRASILSWSYFSDALLSAKGRRVFFADTARGTDDFSVRMVNDSSNADITLFTSASPGEETLEIPSLRSGVFGYAVIRGLSGDADHNNDKRVSVAELSSYLHHSVRQLSQGLQRPLTIASGRSARFIVSQTQ